MGLDRLCDGLHSLRILTEGNPALFYIGAGNVDLQHIYRLLAQALHYLNIVLCGAAADIYNDPGIIFL